MERKVREHDFVVNIKEIAEHLGMTEKEYVEELELEKKMRECARRNRSLSIDQFIRNTSK